MKRLAMVALAAVLALASMGDAKAASYPMGVAAAPGDDVMTGGFNQRVKGTFDNTWTFRLPVDGTPLSASLTISLTRMTDAILGLALSLYQGTPGAGVELARMTEFVVTPTFQFQALNYDGALSAGEDYFLRAQGNAPVGLSISGNLAVAPVPVPAALPLFGAALAGLAVYGRKRRAAAGKAQRAAVAAA